MMDRRFPFLERFAQYQGADSATRRKVAEVESRTGTNAIIHTKSGRITFRYGDSLGGPLGVSIQEVQRWPLAFDPENPDRAISVDDAVRYIQMGKLSRAEKDAMAARAENNEKSEQRSFEDRVLESVTPVALDYVAHNDRARRGVQKVSA
jgi:hypothetical protein